MGLGIREYFTDKVHQSLDRQGIPFFLPFDHDSRTGHLIHGYDVEK